MSDGRAQPMHDRLRGLDGHVARSRVSRWPGRLSWPLASPDGRLYVLALMPTLCPAGGSRRRLFAPRAASSRIGGLATTRRAAGERLVEEATA